MRVEHVKDYLCMIAIALFHKTFAHTFSRIHGTPALTVPANNCNSAISCAAQCDLDIQRCNAFIWDNVEKECSLTNMADYEVSDPGTSEVYLRKTSLTGTRVSLSN